jgi:cleavage stimulation factor subunit 3
MAATNSTTPVLTTTTAEVPLADTSVGTATSSQAAEAVAQDVDAATKSTLEAPIAATLAEATDDTADPSVTTIASSDDTDVKPDVAMKEGAVDPTIAQASGAAEPASVESNEEPSHGSRNGSVQPDFLASVPGSPMHPTVTAPAVPSPSKLKPPTKSTTGMSRVAQLTARIERDPLDADAQLALIADAEQKGDLERTREVYENFLKVFPDAVSGL